MAAQIEIDAKYAVYLTRQAADIAASAATNLCAIPEILDYRAIAGLSTELRDSSPTSARIRSARPAESRVLHRQR